MKRSAAGLVLVACLGCSDGTEAPNAATLDGSSDQAFRESVDKARATLSIERRREFERAIESLSAPTAMASLFSFAADPDGPRRRLYDALHGKTALEVIQMARDGATVVGDARLEANESAAIATLRNIVSAQSQFQSTAVVDVDGDGIGEHGWLTEMAGCCGLRSAKGPIEGELLDPAVLSGSLGIIEGGVANKCGYIFAMYLPGRDGDGPVSERSDGGSPGGESADAAETSWCCYAWPQTFASTGRRAFFVSGDGDVLESPNEMGMYSGRSKRPAGLAAYPVDTNAMTDRVVPGTQARDGQTWRLATH